MSRRSSLSDAQDGDVSTTPTLDPSDHESDEKVRNLKRRFEHVEVRLHIIVAAAPMYWYRTTRKLRMLLPPALLQIQFYQACLNRLKSSILTLIQAFPRKKGRPSQKLSTPRPRQVTRILLPLPQVRLPPLLVWAIIRTLAWVFSQTEVQDRQLQMDSPWCRCILTLCFTLQIRRLHPTLQLTRPTVIPTTTLQAPCRPDQIELFLLALLSLHPFSSHQQSHPKR